jgi:hypothetical protein
VPWELVKLTGKIILAGYLMIFFFVPIVTIIVVMGLYDLAAEKVRGWREQ